MWLRLWMAANIPNSQTQLSLISQTFKKPRRTRGRTSWRVPRLTRFPEYLEYFYPCENYFVLWWYCRRSTLLLFKKFILGLADLSFTQTLKSIFKVFLSSNGCDFIPSRGLDRVCYWYPHTPWSHHLPRPYTGKELEWRWFLRCSCRLLFDSEYLQHKKRDNLLFI